MSNKIVLLCIASFIHFNASCQSNFYDIDSIRDIRIYFYNSNWDELLDSLYIVDNNDRILADLIIDGNDYDSVGVRYKGFSSVSVNRIKNPFNIKIDYVIEGQDHNGVDKIKLSNVIQDPSFIREALSYEIARKYMPSSQANFANVYVNDTLLGLYTNVEAVNKSFLINHFDNKYNTFFKCNPENIDIQIGGENSNLSNSHGLDSADYEPYYTIKSDYGWEELYDFIDTLNNFPDSLNNTLNIDRTIWMHALNYSLINFDSYIGYAQNYYLYKHITDQFNPILWDLNMSFGSFRLTDASQLYFNGFDITQAQQMDPLVHHNFISVSPRPLLRNIFSYERNRKIYLAHIRTIINENFINQDYFIRGQYLQNLIDQDVQNDTNKFYSYSNFTDNLIDPVSIGTSICPGIKQLMDARSNFLISYTGFTGEPSISNISTPQNIILGNDFWITANITDANYARVVYRFGENEIFRYSEMYDDGAHNDGGIGDGVYGCKISNCSNSIDYYIYAENDSAGVFSPERAAFEYYSIRKNIPTGDLVINELMSNNVSTITDNSGNYEDWIELYNNSNYPISTNGMYITDTVSNLYKWALPNYVIPPNSYFIIWADEDGNQGALHSNFKLSNLFSEDIILSNSDGTIIDSVTYLTQLDDISYSRDPNGIGPFSMMTPTFRKNNNIITSINNIDKSSINIYPNPFTNRLNIVSDYKIQITDILGRAILYLNPPYETINTSSWNTGVYFINLIGSSQKRIKLIKIK